MLSTAPSPVLAFDHLAVGLRSVGQRDGRLWRLWVENGDSRESLVWDEQHLSRASESTEGACRVTLEVAFPNADQGRRLGSPFRGVGLLVMGVAGVGPLMAMSAVDKKKIVTRCVEDLAMMYRRLRPNDERDVPPSVR